MTEKRFIQGGDSYSSRYLHSDEKFRKETNWNINLPIEREFKCGECIVTDKDDTAYHIDELVTLLNELHDENEQLKKEFEDWKSNCLSTINENSILWNEIAIMREQGAKPSSVFEKYCSKFKGDME